MKIRNIFGTKFRGTIGKDMVASSWRGHEYVRRYVVPRDPKTIRQLEHRAIWREAVAAWHALSADERRFYDAQAKGMTGFNLFVGRYVRRKRGEGWEPDRTESRARDSATPEITPAETSRPRPSPKAPISGKTSTVDG